MSSVEYVFARSSSPSWWKRHRHFVLLCVGLFLGYQLSSGGTEATAERRIPEPSSPRITHSTPAETGSVTPPSTR